MRGPQAGPRRCPRERPRGCPEAIFHHHRGTECTKIAHRRSLAIFNRRRGYRREFRSEDGFYLFSSQKKSRFASDFLRRRNRESWGLKKSRDFFGAVKIAAATAENRAILVHSAVAPLLCRSVARPRGHRATKKNNPVLPFLGCLDFLG